MISVEDRQECLSSLHPPVVPVKAGPAVDISKLRFSAEQEDAERNYRKRSEKLRPLVQPPRE
jgi:hypothetical protein